LSERDDAWVFKTTAKLMQAPEVRASFSLV